MPHVYRDVRNLEGKPKVDGGECVRLSNPQEIIVNLWRTAEDAMQGARHDAVRALLVVGNAAARL
jgi:hypothetical protein